MKVYRFSLFMAFIAMLTGMTPAYAKNDSASLDIEIDHLRDVYSLPETWDLLNRTSSSLSSQYSGLLAKVNRRWIESRIDVPEGTGISLNSEVLENAEREYGIAAASRLKLWQRISQVSEDLPVQTKLKLVNNFFNKVAFSSDEENWGKRDYWSSPIELLTNNSGDCEDYAIAKYFTLAAMGIPIDRLRIVYVKSVALSSAHMVLAYYDESTKEPVILDNVNAKIVAASERQDLVPVFGFNG